MEELVSIIIPIYNVEKYLEVCIDSIINQTYKNLEIILVNDGSTDNSYNICKKFEEIDNRIVLVNKENGGLSDARNAGIEKAKGNYICFIDSDDYIDNEFIEMLYKAIKENDVDISQCGYKRFENSGKVVETHAYNESKSIKSRDFMIDSYFGHVDNIVVWNKMYKTSIIKNMKFPVGKIHEDEFFTYKVLDRCENVFVIKECLYNYRKNFDGIMLSKYNIKRLDVLDALAERIIFYQEKKDKQLYNLTYLTYLECLISCYVNVKKHIVSNKDILKDLKKTYRKQYNNIKSCNNIRGKTIIRHTIFYINPNLYMFIIEMNKKV